MHKLRQIFRGGGGNLSPYYPKFLVDEHRNITVVMEGAVGEIPHLLLESTTVIPQGTPF